MSYWDEGDLYSVHLYNGAFQVIKWNDWFVPIKTYHVRRGRNLRRLSCDCAASEMPKCRHRRVVLIFEEMERVGKGWFYDWVDQSWEPPLSYPIHRIVERVRLRDY